MRIKMLGVIAATIGLAFSSACDDGSHYSPTAPSCLDCNGTVQITKVAVMLEPDGTLPSDALIVNVSMDFNVPDDEFLRVTVCISDFIDKTRGGCQMNGKIMSMFTNPHRVRIGVQRREPLPGDIIYIHTWVAKRSYSRPPQAYEGIPLPNINDPDVLDLHTTVIEIP